MIDGDAATQPTPQNTFYEKTVVLLQLGIILLAFSMEPAAGLALHHAWRSVPDNSEDWAQLRKQLAEIRNQRCELAHRQIMLRNEPRMFAAQFWRDFSRAMLAKSRRNTKNRLPLLVLASAGLGTALAHAQVVVHADPNTVIAIDLSTSVGTPGPDEKTDFQKNVNGVTHVLSYLTSGSSVTVIGITDHSYAQPYILLSPHISDDPGYFGERLTRARAQLIHAWVERSAHLTHAFRHTDIIGAIQLASDLFAQKPTSGSRTFIIFSDMRQNTSDLNVERMRLVPRLTGPSKRFGPIPHLRNVEGFVLGVDGAGKSSAYRQSLRRFWTDWMAVDSDSVLREAPEGGGGMFSERAPADPNADGSRRR